MIVDTHVHTVAADRQRYPLAPAYTFDWVRDHPVPTEDLVPRMARAGVDRVVLVHPASAHGYDNGYTADSLRNFPGRFAGVCNIDVLATDAAERLRHWTARGMRGIRLFTTVPGGEQDWLDSPRTFPVWEEAARLGVPVCVQMTFRRFDALRRMLDRFPRVTVALDHVAGAAGRGPGSDGAKALFALAGYPQLHVKFSTGSLDRNVNPQAREFYAALIAAFGAGRLLWGSNYPATWHDDYGALLSLARETLAFAGDGDRALMFGGNALRLWPELA